MDRRKIMQLSVGAVALVAGLVPATAQADSGGPSCVGQLATALAGPQYGQVVSSFAHDVQPFGAVVSFNATSPKEACPFGP